MGLFCHANSLKWSAFFGWNSLFFHAKIMGLQERKYFPLRKTLPEERKWNGEALFLWISYREMKMLSTLQSHCHWSSQPREAKISGSLATLCLPRLCSGQFYSYEIPKILSSRQQEDKINYHSSKTVPLLLEFPVNKGEKTTFLSLWPLLEGRNLSKLYTLLKEWMWFSQLFCLRHSLDFCPTSSRDFGATHGECFVVRRSIVPSAGEALSFQWLWAQDCRCFRMKEAAYKGSNL